MKVIITNKLKELLSELQKNKKHSMLVLEYKEINHKIFHSCKRIVTDSETDEVFKSMNQSIIARHKKF